MPLCLKLAKPWYFLDDYGNQYAIRLLSNSNINVFSWKLGGISMFQKTLILIISELKITMVIVFY